MQTEIHNNMRQLPNMIDDLLGTRPRDGVNKAATRRRSRFRLGLTLVELLVVIAIIGVLIGLILPAVEMARESSRRAACANNLKQLGLAAKLHLDAHSIFPTGGWGSEWVGDPDAGFGPKQPGGWVYNVLPYIEQAPLREKGRRMALAEKKATLVEVMQTPIAVFNCPSRRLARPYPYHGGALQNANQPNEVAKSDYVINKIVSYRKSEVITADIQLKGGMSNTALAGEKSLANEHYKDGDGEGDKLSMYAGESSDIARNVGANAFQDDKASPSSFGAAHPGVCQFVFCDGSVRAIAYEDPIKP